MKKSLLSVMLGSILVSGLTACTSTATAPVQVSNTAVKYENEQYQLNWQQDNQANIDILVSTENNIDTATLIADDIQATSFNWQPAADHQRYYFFFKPENGDTVMTTTRLVPLDGGRNFRDLGGYKTADGHTVKWGKIYRSGVLSNLTAADYALIEQLDIATVVDFRANSERQSEVTKWQASDIEMINKDYEMDMDMGQIGKILRDPNLNRDMLEGMMVKMYPHILQDQTSNYTQMFNRLVSKDDALLFHCTAGKDRTGISAALILTVLGVDRQTIIDDYMASNTYLEHGSLMPKETENMDPKYLAMMKFFATLPEEVTQPLMGVTQPLIESVFTAMEAKHGTALNYIQQELNVSDDDIKVMRSKYLM